MVQNVSCPITAGIATHSPLAPLLYVDSVPQMPTNSTSIREFLFPDLEPGGTSSTWKVSVPFVNAARIGILPVVGGSFSDPVDPVFSGAPSRPNIWSSGARSEDRIEHHVGPRLQCEVVRVPATGQFAAIHATFRPEDFQGVLEIRTEVGRRPVWTGLRREPGKLADHVRTIGECRQMRSPGIHLPGCGRVCRGGRARMWSPDRP